LILASDSDFNAIKNFKTIVIRVSNGIFEISPKIPFRSQIVIRKDNIKFEFDMCEVDYFAPTNMKHVVLN